MSAHLLFSGSTHCARDETLNPISGLLALAIGMMLSVLAPAQAQEQRMAAVVFRVVNGDTLDVRLNNGRAVGVQLIGADAPEASQQFWRDRIQGSEDLRRRTLDYMEKAATEYTRRAIEGRPVSLEPDVEQVDRFGRCLAYVWTPSGSFNAQIVRDGYAVPRPIPPDVRYSAAIEQAYREAQPATPDGAEQPPEDAAQRQSPPDLEHAHLQPQVAGKRISLSAIGLPSDEG